MLPTLAFEKAFSKAVGLTWLHDGVEVLMPTRLRLRYCRYGRSWLSQAAGLTLKIAWWLRLFVMLFRTYRISQNLGLKVAKTWMSLEPSGFAFLLRFLNHFRTLRCLWYDLDVLLT